MLPLFTDHLLTSLQNIVPSDRAQNEQCGLSHLSCQLSLIVTFLLSPTQAIFKPG